MNKREIVLRVAGVFLSLFVLYVVSVGPILGFVISRAEFRGGIWMRSLRVAIWTYWPIIQLGSQNPAISSAMSDYVTFFERLLAAKGENRGGVASWRVNSLRPRAHCTHHPFPLASRPSWRCL